MKKLKDRSLEDCESVLIVTSMKGPMIECHGEKWFDGWMEVDGVRMCHDCFEKRYPPEEFARRDGEIYFYLKDEEYGWLSNFWPSPFTDGGRLWPTNEHYYQAHRASDTRLREWIRSAPSPYHAMKAGRALRAEKGECPADWDSRKVDVMRDGLRLKFSIPDMRARLIATGDAPLHEDSPTDMFWGVRGEDMLGKLLMEVRQEVRRAHRPAPGDNPAQHRGRRGLHGMQARVRQGYIRLRRYPANG
jgi:ribA/ribD-fused uncharacterized protein